MLLSNNTGNLDIGLKEVPGLFCNYIAIGSIIRNKISDCEKNKSVVKRNGSIYIFAALFL